MRYIQYKQITNKILDEEISDLSTIRALLIYLKDKNIYCSMRLDDSLAHEQVRVLEVSDSSFKFMVIGSTGTLRLSASISKIKHLEIITNIDEIVRLNPDISRWSLLDPSTMNEV